MSKLDAPAVTPFEVHVAEQALMDLRRRLARTRWPDPLPASDWSDGTEEGFLRRLVEYWRDEFDWRAAEAQQNRWPQFTTEIDGQRLHFFHVRSPHPDASPLVLTHGWPSTPLEFLKVLGPLTDPTAYGGTESDAFHVIAPSLPGFGWSSPLADTGWHPRRIATAWLELMARLGYPRFVAHGTDWGSVVSTAMARQAPERLQGLHLTLLVSGLRSVDSRLTEDEQRLLEANERRRAVENGYVALQSTKPQTLSYALSDSPIGQAAWIVEKLRSWTDCDGDLESVVSRDEVLSSVTTFWVTGTGGSSGRLYFEAARGAANGVLPSGRVEVPTAVALFPRELYPTSRRIASDFYDIVRWTPMPQGGHFAALEQPELLVGDLREFVAGL